MIGSNLPESVTSFFKPQSLNTVKSNLVFDVQGEKIAYERIYTDYYFSLFNAYKSKIAINLPENKIINQSNWETLLRAGHDGFVMTFAPYIPGMKSQTEMSKMMGCFELARLQGFGNLDLGLAPRGSIMKISIAQSLEDMAFDLMEVKPENPVCAFTAGMILGCFNLSMASENISIHDMDIIEKMYLEGPDIIQVEYGCLIQGESEFTLHIK